MTTLVVDADHTAGSDNVRCPLHGRVSLQEGGHRGTSVVANRLLILIQAYIQGYNDPQFHDMLGAISTVLFLATPHDGSGLADHLNNLLTVTFRSSKPYVKDLQKNSVTIIETNDQFRLHTRRMDIISFYEELPSITIPKEIVRDDPSMSI